MSIVVEFSGTPDAGKTTVLNSLYSEFKKQGKHVILLGEANGEKLPPHNLRGTLAYNEWVGRNACNGIMEALKKNPDLLLVDRGLLDFRFWNYFYEQNGKTTHDEVQALQAKPEFNDKALVPDLFLAVTVSLEEAIRRNPSLAQKADWVENHNALFDSFYRSYKGPKSTLDTTQLSREGVISSSLDIIYDQFPELKPTPHQDAGDIEK